MTGTGKPEKKQNQDILEGTGRKAKRWQIQIMNTYTFIAEFRGGTYVSQVRSSDYRSALLVWAKALDIDSVKYLGKKSKNELIQKALYECPLPLTGLVNVWCAYLPISIGAFLVNFVETR